MNDNKDTNRVCVELLSKALEKPVTNSKQSYHLLERLSTCFIQVSRDVYNLSIELYGNGTPGGIKYKVLSIQENQNRLSERLDDLSEFLVKELTDIKKMVGDKVVQPAPSKEDSDWFKLVVNWFIDKVLPSIVITIILWLTSGAIFIYLLQNGYIK